MLEQKNLIAVARKWWVVLLAAAIVGGLVARAVAAFLTPTYESTVRLLTGPTSSDVNTLDAAGGLARTYSELATSQPQLQAVAEELNLTVSPDRLAEDVQSTSNDVTRILAIRVRQSSADGAFQFATRLGDRMVALSKAGSERDAELVDNLLRQDVIAQFTEAQRDQIRQAASTVLSAQRAPGTLTIIDPPRRADAPVAPKIPLIVLLGVLCGLALVGVLLVIRERASGTIDDARDLTATVEAPTLGTVDGAGLRSGLVVPAGAAGPAPRQIRGIADQISYLTRDGSARSLVFITAERGVPSALLAANIGAALADLNLGVVVVDADPGRRDVTRVFGLAHEQGLTDFFAAPTSRGAHDEVAELLGVSVPQRITVVPAGTSGGGHRRLDPRRVNELVKMLRDDFDIVLIVPPALEDSPDALVWAECTDATVIVAEQRASMTEDVGRAVARVRALRVRIAGTVLCGGRGVPGLGALLPRRGRKQPKPAYAAASDVRNADDFDGGRIRTVPHDRAGDARPHEHDLPADGQAAISSEHANGSTLADGDGAMSAPPGDATEPHPPRRSG